MGMARPTPVRRHLERYAAAVRVAPAFEGLRDHGTSPPDGTIVELRSLLGREVGEATEKSIAEAIILGFATSGRPIEDVVILRDTTASGVFKVMVFQRDSLVKAGQGRGRTRPTLRAISPHESAAESRSARNGH